MGKDSSKSSKTKTEKNLKKTNDKASTKDGHKATVTGLVWDPSTLLASARTWSSDTPEAGTWTNVLFPSTKHAKLAMAGKTEKQRGKNAVKSGSWAAEWAGELDDSAMNGGKLAKTTPKVPLTAPGWDGGRGIPFTIAHYGVPATYGVAALATALAVGRLVVDVIILALPREPADPMS